MTDDRIYLQRILDAIGKIESYVSTGPEDYMSESRSRHAARSQLEDIGEAI